MTIIMLRAYFRNEPLHYNCNMQRFDRRWAATVAKHGQAEGPAHLCAWATF
jgi:hypothetical protein